MNLLFPFIRYVRSKIWRSMLLRVPMSHLPTLDHSVLSRTSSKCGYQNRSLLFHLHKLCQICNSSAFLYTKYLHTKRIHILHVHLCILTKVNNYFPGRVAPPCSRRKCWRMPMCKWTKMRTLEDIFGGVNNFNHLFMISSVDDGDLTTTWENSLTPQKLSWSTCVRCINSTIFPLEAESLRTTLIKWVCDSRKHKYLLVLDKLLDCYEVNKEIEQIYWGGLNHATLGLQ